MEEKFAQLQTLIEADQGLVEKLFSLETAEEVQSLLKEQELEFSLEEINMLRDGIIKVLEKGANGELSDEELEDVAGGVAACTACAIICAGVAVTSGGLAVACGGLAVVTGGLAVGTAIGGGALIYQQETNRRW